jgi:Tol biopolymer transport system component
MAPTARLRDKGMLQAVVLPAALLIALTAACLAVLLTSERSAEAAFAGKNGRIAFTLFPEEYPESGDSEIYKMLPDGSGLKQVTFNSTNDVRPAWSPDGTKIAFSRFEKIFVKDTTNGQVLRLSDIAGISGFDSAWSPDGTRLAFDSYRDGDTEIYTMNSSDGSGVETLTDNQNHDVGPTWSPDGTKIAFNRDYDIWVMNADGTNQKNLTNTTGASEYEPNWSPDGTKIVFEKWGGELAATDLFVINADGSGLVNLTKTPTLSEDFPVWAPNGRELAFTEQNDIWVMNADGTNRNNLTNTPNVTEFMGDWQRIATP